jgi:hypothetical protein
VPSKALKKFSLYGFIFPALMAGIFLKFFFSVHEGFWSDELLSLNYALNSNSQSIYWDNTPPLFYFLLKQWLHWLPHDPLGLRSLNLLVSLLVPVVAFFSSGKIFSSSERWLYAALLSVSSLSLFFGTEVRVYGLVELVAVWNLSLFLQSVKAKKASGWLAFSGLLLLSLHYFTVLLVAAELSVWLFLFPRQSREMFKSRWRVVLAALIVVLIGTMIWKGIDFRTLKSRALNDPSYYLNGMYRIFRLLCVDSNSFALLFAFLLWRDGRFRPLQYVLSFCLIFSMLVSGLFSLEVLNPRYFIFLNPVIFIVLTAAFFEKKKINRAVAAVLVALNLWSVYRSLGLQKSGMKPAADYINTHYVPERTWLLIPENRAYYYPYLNAFSADPAGPRGKKSVLVLCKEISLSEDLMRRTFADLQARGFVLKRTIAFGPKSGEGVFEVMVLHEMERRSL